MSNSDLAALNMTCNFCKQKNPWAKAHIIPKALFLDCDNEAHGLKKHKLGERTKRVPKGIYDDRLWCLKCEKRFERLDNYAINILRKPLSNQVFEAENGSIYKITIDDPDTLKLFFISLLWRASTSGNDFYRSVEIGPFLKTAKELLDSESPGTTDDFSVVLSRLTDEKNLIYNPTRIRYSGINFYKFRIGQSLIQIKVDRRPLPSVFSPVALGQSNELFILSVPLDAEAKQTAHEIAKAANHSRQRRRP